MDDFGIIKLQNIAYVNSQIASALIELEAMKADNRQHPDGEPYGERQINALIDRYQLNHNAVLTNFQNGL